MSFSMTVAKPRCTAVAMSTRAAAFKGKAVVVRKAMSVRTAKFGVRAMAVEEPKVGAPVVSEPVVGAPMDAAEPVVAAPVSTEPVEAAEKPVAADAAIDPADGSIAYGAALGNSGDALLSNAMAVFKGGNASEMINGRAAMVGFFAAFLTELATGDSVTTQMFNMRDVGVRVLYLPKLAFFLIPATVILVMLSSFAPVARGSDANGLNVQAKPWGPFTPNAEVINGRAAMIGLPLLLAVEGMTGAALF